LDKLLKEDAMSKQLSEGLGKFVHLVERQMLLHQELGKLVRQHTAAELGIPYHFITISRDIGAWGNAVASETAKRLQWKVYDQEIVDYIAKDRHIRRNLVDQMDEKAQSRIQESVARWLSTAQGQIYGSDEYHVALIKALATLAAQGQSILLGRGGAYALQEQPGLHVRITASLPVRVQRVSKRWNISAAEARKIVQKTDAERREFIQRHFKPERDDSRFFHLVFNTDALSVNHVVAAIIGIIEQSRQNIGVPQTPVFDSLAFQSSEQAPVQAMH
jgi:CMP/dCMP kinase